jgi:protein SCO1/2
VKPATLHAALAALVAVLALAGAPAAVAGEPQPGAETQEINPRYLLADSRGRAISNEDFPGRYQLISFGYTFCPDVCPTTLAAMAQILRQLGERAAKLQPIFITVDPERDTREALAKYTAYFDPRIIGLTGPTEYVRAAAEHYKVTYRKYLAPGAPPDRYSIDHSAGMILLGPDGQFAAKFAYAESPQETAARIAKIMAADEAVKSK